MTFRGGGAEVLAEAGLGLQDPHAAGHDDLPAVPVQPSGACVERFRLVQLLFRPYQVVRSRRLNVPAGHNQPRQSLAQALRTIDHATSQHRLQQAHVARINGVPFQRADETLSRR